MSNVNNASRDMIGAAMHYAEHGYRIFPCISRDKAPALGHWPQKATTHRATIENWLIKEYPGCNLGLLANGLIVIDIDPDGHGLFAEHPDLRSATPLVQRTPRGGYHLVFNKPDGKVWKNHTAGRLGGKGVDVKTDNGYILVAPSYVVDPDKGINGRYAWDNGIVHRDKLPDPPAWLVDLLDDLFAKPAPAPCSFHRPFLPADGDRSHNYAEAVLAGEGANVRGATDGTRNATLNTAALKAGHYVGSGLLSATRVEAELTEAAKSAGLTDKEIRSTIRSGLTAGAKEPRWAPERAGEEVQVDLSALMAPSAVPEAVGPVDPGPFPDRLLEVPGFVGEVMNFCLETAPYPNPVMAFAGALSLQAFLGARKVRDSGDNRTNLYLLGLAHSAAGKDYPRKVNTRIVHEVGLTGCLGERFASGEGIQDALFQTPGMLFQTDEIDGMLQSINKAKDARHEAVMTTLLTMYSSSNSVFPMRRKAGPESPGVIDQPCLVIFGTAIPNHYYEALSERMLTNGFFARMIIIESGPRAPGQEPSIRDLPPRVLETAQWWADYRPGTVGLEDWRPIPAVIEHSDEAKRLLIETRREAEAEYGKAEKAGDSVGTTVWGRVSEHVRKLALLHAISGNHRSPHIGLAAVEWASAFVMHQTRRMLFMAASHMADNPFHAECQKLMKKLRDAPGNELPHSVLLKRMKTDAKTFSMLIETLAQQGDIEVSTTAKPGWPIRSYRLAGGVNLQGETSPGGET